MMAEERAIHPASQEFLKILEDIRSLHLAKSKDYGSDTDPFANIRNGAEFVGISPWRGCMVRVCDKIQRLKTYCQKGTLVHESVEDTLMDLACYSILCLVLHREGESDARPDAAAQ